MRFESNFTKDRKYALAKESGLGNGDFRVFSEQYALLIKWWEKYAIFNFFLLPAGINFFKIRSFCPQQIRCKFVFIFINDIEEMIKK